MYYLMREDMKDFKGLVKSLRNRGLSRSIFSCTNERCVGVAVHISKTGLDNEYILLSEIMCSEDPKISWITARKRCENEEDFLNKIDKLIEKEK